jgi:hypothetical protein
MSPRLSRYHAVESRGKRWGSGLRQIAWPRDASSPSGSTRWRCGPRGMTRRWLLVRRCCCQVCWQNFPGEDSATWSPRWPGLLSLRGSLHEGPQPSGRIPPPSTAIPRYQHGPRGGCRSRGPRDPRCARPGNASWSSDGRARFAGFRRQHGTRCPRGQAREPGQIHSQGWLVEMWPRPSPSMRELADELSWWSDSPSIPVNQDLSAYRDAVRRLREANLVAPKNPTSSGSPACTTRL